MLSELKLEVAKLREDHKLIINNVIDYYEKKYPKLTDSSWDYYAIGNFEHIASLTVNLNIELLEKYFAEGVVLSWQKPMPEDRRFSIYKKYNVRWTMDLAQEFQTATSATEFLLESIANEILEIKDKIFLYPILSRGPMIDPTTFEPIFMFYGLWGSELGDSPIYL